MIGMTASATPWEIFWDKATGPLADTVSAGDKIRVEVDMGTVHDEIPGGSHMGNLAVRTDNEEEQRFVSAATEYPAATYNALELKTDDTYGYKYRTVSAEITMPSDNAAAIEAIANNGLVVLYNNAQYTMNTKLPRSVYRLEITNETTGKTLYKLTGADLKNYMFDGANATPIIAGSEIEAYGSKVTGGADWWAYVNLYTGPIEGVDDGDLIVAYSKVWYPTGTFTGGGTNLNAGMKIDGGWKAGSLIDAQNDLDSYTKAETKVDPTYGCQYKELPIQKRHEVIEGKDTLVESKVPEGGGAQIAADGLQILFGGTGNNFAVNPMEVYGLSLYNATKEKEIYSIDGWALQDATGTQDEREVLFKTVYDDEVAVPSGLTLSGAQSIVFDGQKVTPTIAGQYAFNAEISTTAAPNAKLNVYAVANGETSLVKSTAFTANTEGNFQNGQVVFNVYDSMVGKEFAFGYEQADGSVVTLKDVTLVRLGDAVDPDPVVIKEWTPKEMADNAEAKTRFTYPTKTATVGYRMFRQCRAAAGQCGLGTLYRPVVPRRRHDRRL